MENKIEFGGLILPYEYDFFDITNFQMTHFTSRVGDLLISYASGARNTVGGPKSKIRTLCIANYTQLLTSTGALY